MTVANQIVEYLEAHGKTTRPELERVFGLCEKTVDSAIRKLEMLGCIKRAGRTPKIHRKRSAVVFVLTGSDVDLSKIGDCRGRPRLSIAVPKVSSDALSLAMNAFFGKEAA